MNKVFYLKNEQRNPQWHTIDADGQVLGRLCTQIADILRGKDEAEYTPFTDSGDYVIVINCEKVKLTGNKWNDKLYDHYTGYRSGLRRVPAKEVFKKDPAELIMHGVKGMLPKNKLNRSILKKLKVYVGNQHPHEGQVNAPVKVLRNAKPKAPKKVVKKAGTTPVAKEVKAIKTPKAITPKTAKATTSKTTTRAKKDA